MIYDIYIYIIIIIIIMKNNDNNNDDNNNNLYIYMILGLSCDLVISNSWKKPVVRLRKCHSLWLLSRSC